MVQEAQTKEAVHGQKMIELKIRFWTNNLASGTGKIVPKHAWTKGVVRIERNDSHGIVPGSPIPFNSLLDLGLAIEKCLMGHGIHLHRSRRMRKYIYVGEE